MARIWQAGKTALVKMAPMSHHIRTIYIYLGQSLKLRTTEGCWHKICSVQFWPFADWVVRGTWAMIQQRSSSSLFYRTPLQAVLAWTGMSTLFLMLFIQHFLCRPRRRPPSKVPWRMVLERLSWLVICLNHASYRLLTFAGRGFRGLKRKLILLRIRSLILCSK